MESATQDDRSAELDALRAEMVAKMPEPERCALNTMYGLMDIIVGSDTIEYAEHLFDDHTNLHAGEIILSFLRFLDDAGRLEARYFQQFHVTGLRRFDVAKNAQTLFEFEETMRQARVNHAMAEGANSVRH